MLPVILCKDHFDVFVTYLGRNMRELTKRPMDNFFVVDIK